MRFVGMLLWALLPCVVTAPQVTAQAAIDPPAKPQIDAITIDDLQNATITGVIVYAGQIRWSGDNIVRVWLQYWRFNIQIGPVTAIKWTLDTSGKYGEKDAKRRHYAHSATIGRPDMTPEQHGSGARAVVWTLDGNTLTLLRVFETGGRTVRIMFTRTTSGLLCRAEGAYARETGGGNPKTKDPDRGGYFEFIGAKQTSSACQVRKG
jgi:hypothetical protein